LFHSRSLELARIGNDKYFIAINQSNLGDVLCELGEKKSAIKCYENGMSEFIKIFAPSHGQVQRTLSNLRYVKSVMETDLAEQYN
jgi:predicted negative regulator of RcsB-dependent stress response